MYVYAQWKPSYVTVTGSYSNLPGNYVANGLTLGGDGSLYMAYWTNNTGKTVSINVSVSAIRVPIVNNYHEVRVCVNSTTDDRYNGVVMYFLAESEYYYTSKTATISVPNGQNLIIYNHNDNRTIWTITYN